MPDIYEAVSRTIIGLLIDEPFFAHLLGSIPREVSDRTETVGLELNSFGPRLLINKEYFLKTLRSEKQRSAVIKHEALHVAFSHCCRRSDKHIKDVFDVAADLVVNQFVRESTLPEDAVTLSSFAALGLKPDDTLENYYAALMKHYSSDMGGAAMKEMLPVKRTMKVRAPVVRAMKEMLPVVMPSNCRRAGKANLARRKKRPLPQVPFERSCSNSGMGTISTGAPRTRPQPMPWRIS